MNFKKLIALGLVGVMTMSLAACGGEEKTESSGDKNQSGSTSEEKKQSVSLTMWGSENDQTLLRKWADEFIEANKDAVDLTIEIGVESEANAKDNILKDVEAGADVFSFADDQVPELVAGGGLQEITSELGKDDVSKRNVESSVKAATYDGKLYAYPRTADNGYFLVYDKSYFTDEDVKTMEGILAVCERENKSFQMELSDAWYNYSFFSGAGLTATLADDKVSTECNWNATDTDITGVQVAEAILELTKSPAFVDSSDIDQATIPEIKAGNCIATITGTWDSKVLTEAWGENFGACKLPTFKCAGKDVQMGSFTGFKLVGVNPHSSNVVWAAKLADYITSEKCQVENFTTNQVGPSNIAAAADEAVAKDPGIAAVQAQSEFATQQLVGGNYWEPANTLGKTLADGNPDGVDLQKLLDDCVAGITAKVEQ